MDYTEMDSHTLNITNSLIVKIENLPQGLKSFDCRHTSIPVIENLPIGLEIFLYYNTNIKFVDNVSIDKINFTLKGYSSIKRAQLRMKR